MSELTNADRSTRVAEVLRHFSLRTRFTLDLRHPSVDCAELVGDFLCDLRHFCDRRGVDFAVANEHGQRHYDAEVQDERRRDRHD